MTEEFTAADKRRLEKAMRAQRVVADKGALFDRPIPDELLTPYVLKDGETSNRREIQRKYAQRPQNIHRCWNRFSLYLPELMYHDTPQRVFEMSTGHGGMLEVARYFGHEVLGNDFANMVSDSPADSSATHRRANDENFSRSVDDYGIPIPQDGTAKDWPYRRIIEAIDMPIMLFDAGKIPYPLDDKSQDVVICMQAIEHYCHPDDWMLIVDEFCRIATKTIVILLNPLFPRFKTDPDYVASFHAFRAGMQNYRKNGFTTTSCHIHWAEPLGFKLTAN